MFGALIRLRSFWEATFILPLPFPSSTTSIVLIVDDDDEHFGESDDVGAFAPGTVEMGVWKACEEDVRGSTERFARLIAQCYADAGYGLEYSLADVEAGFKRHRMGS